ncbi:lamin tail domain-containing protein [Anditalea andensis]|uniref:lamin tail domain-containing protein n=1 Tax=Anditalea andensis TaxID=1048983 RepID=UPI0013E03C4C|nr:lamin tail domain-containing protein [Anditalea andensis]
MITPDSERTVPNGPNTYSGAINLYILPSKEEYIAPSKVLGLSQIATYNVAFSRETSIQSNKINQLNLQYQIFKNGSSNYLPLTQLRALNQREPYMDTSQTHIDKSQIENVEIISSEVVRVTFSDFPDPATVILPDRYTVAGFKTCKVSLLNNPNQVDIYLCSGLSLGDSVILQVTNIPMESGKKILSQTFHLIYTDGLSEIYVRDENTIELIPSLEFTLETFDPTLLEIVEGFFTFQVVSAASHKLALKVSPPLEAGIFYQLKIPNRKGPEGQIISSSIRDLVLDVTAPKPVYLMPQDKHTILVEFDEAIDPVMAVVPQHYSLNGRTPIEAIPLSNPQQVLLVMDDELYIDVDTELSIINIQDRSGNTVSSPFRLSTNLRIHDEPGYKSIVINEIMAAPRAGLILPNAEYVELLNVSNVDINISGFRLHNSRSSTAIPAGTIIAPGEYLILCPNARRTLFEPYGRVIGMTSWPTLLNTADQVLFYDREGNLIDNVSYTPGTYGSTQVAQGGYSLEIANPYSQCNLPHNLRPSISPFRGTPGGVNSIYDTTPDRIPPILQSVSVLNETQIIVSFSKPVSDEPSNVSWNLYPEVIIISSEYYLGDQSQLILTLDRPLTENTLYTLQVKNIRDCSGNLISAAGSTTTFALPVAAEKGDIIINEILFNPHTGTPKFVEIYNNVDKYINLKNWKLGNESGSMVSNRRVLAAEDLIISPHAYLAITTDAAILTQMYPKATNLLEIGTLPSYPIREGTVFLLNETEDIIERLDYHENHHHPLLNVPRGVSLERINPLQMSNEPQNWTSAAGAIGYATPGFKNSQFYTEENLGQGITVSPEVFAPETSGSQNFTTIQYQMDRPGFVGSIKIFDISGKLIKEIIQNEIWGTSGFYTWNGTDMNGKKVKIGYYIIWVELLNLEGKVINLKKSVVVSTKIR